VRKCIERLVVGGKSSRESLKGQPTDICTRIEEPRPKGQEQVGNSGVVVVLCVSDGVIQVSYIDALKVVIVIGYLCFDGL
jgi:hypothetical protein